MASESATVSMGGRRRSLAGVWLCLFAWFGFAAPSRAERIPETDVEAAYLVNFLRYTQWPPRSFESAESPYVISVIGPKPVADRVRAVAFAAGRIGGRSIEVHSISFQRGSLDAPFQSEQDRQSLARIRASHLVFFHSDAGQLRPQAMSDLWGYPVLTVSNAPGFTDSGGMLGLFRSSGNIVFEANPVAIRSSSLVLSAKVLKLARVASRANR